MIDVITPAEVEAEILRLSRLLDLATAEIAKRGRACANAKIDHRVAFATARLAATGTIPEREDVATLASQDEARVYELAAATLGAAQDAARNTRSQLDALRSVNANVRVQAGL